jgi:hypothetical protein
MLIILNRKTPQLKNTRFGAINTFSENIKISEKNSSHLLIHADRNKSIRRGHQSSAYRGSVYKGVSQNGSKWQVFYTLNSRKIYAGIIPTEGGAAELYDKLEIFHVGTKAKTNFSYTIAELETMLKSFEDISA